MNASYKNFTFSLRQFLALPFLALLLLLIVVVVWVFYENSMNLGRQMEQQLAVVLNSRVNLYLDHLFSEPVASVNAVNRLYRSGKLNADNVEDQAKQLATFMSTMPELSVLNLGLSDGRHIGVNRSLSNGVLHTSVVSSKTHPYREVYSVSEDGQRDLFVFKDPTPFITSTRPWYRHAEREHKASWYPIYRYSQSEIADVTGNFAIGFSMPIYDEHDKLLGVINSDIALGQISRYLKLLPLGEGGVAFIANEQNQLIGISNDTPLFIKQENNADGYSRLQLIHFNNIDSLLVRAAGERLPQTHVGSNYLTVNGAEYIENVREFTTSEGLKLKVVILLPEKQFFPLIQSDFKSMLAFVSVAFGIGICLVVLAAYQLSKPIVKMTKWADQLTKGNWELLNNNDTHIMKDYPIHEIRQLRTSFSEMAKSLHETVATLEQRVIERTAELEMVNSNLSELSNTDGMTGIANRRKFDAVLASEWSRSTRTGQPLVLALIDVDWFKKYNDHYGHLAGDDCLRNVAHILTAKIRRSSDLVARFGGEEFAIIAPAINKENALEMANMICHAVADLSLPHAMSPFGKLTVSIGVALIVPTTAIHSNTLIQAADEALYHAKDSGRNQVIYADINIVDENNYYETDFKFDQL